MNYLKNCPNCSTTLRFPASQGTVLVRCPVCSHRFQFNSSIDTEYSHEEKDAGAFYFKPSKKEYLNLILDLLYAPIDYFNTKIKLQTTQKKTTIHSWKKPKLLIEVLLFLILLLYLVRGLKMDEMNPTTTETKTEKDSSEPVEKEVLPPRPFLNESSEPNINI